MATERVELSSGVRISSDTLRALRYVSAPATALALRRQPAKSVGAVTARAIAEPFGEGSTSRIPAAICISDTVRRVRAVIRGKKQSESTSRNYRTFRKGRQAS